MSEPIYAYAGVRVFEITKEEAKAHWKKNKFKANEVVAEGKFYKLVKGKAEFVFFIPATKS